MIRQIFLVALFTTVLIAILLFALKNNQTVPIDLVIVRLDAVPLWAVMIVSFLVGIALSSLLFVFAIIGLYWNHRTALKELAKLRTRSETVGISTGYPDSEHRS